MSCNHLFAKNDWNEGLAEKCPDCGMFRRFENPDSPDGGWGEWRTPARPVGVPTLPPTEPTGPPRARVTPAPPAGQRREKPPARKKAGRPRKDGVYDQRIAGLVRKSTLDMLIAVANVKGISKTAAIREALEQYVGQEARPETEDRR